LELSAEAMLQRCLALPLFAVLAACAGDQSEYPSLDIRPAERASGTMQPPPAEPLLTPPPSATLDRLAQLTRDAEASHKAFLGQVAGTRLAITAGRGAAVGSDAWARAEAALADVRAARAKTMASLADLDRLFVDAGTQGQATDRIGAARDRVEGLLASEDRTVGELSVNLP
jgi:hypothetical protein